MVFQRYRSDAGDGARLAPVTVGREAVPEASDTSDNSEEVIVLPQRAVSCLLPGRYPVLQHKNKPGGMQEIQAVSFALAVRSKIRQIQHVNQH